MTLYGIIFYLLAAVILIAAVTAVFSRHAVHAVVYLIVSFFGTALLFYLLGAPFLAAIEIIIYAGAIMVLFLFIIMTLRIEPSRKPVKVYIHQWIPAILLAGVCLAVTGLFVFTSSASGHVLKLAALSPTAFGELLFRDYWFAVEIASFLLFVALVGALYLGRMGTGDQNPSQEGRR